MRPHVVRRTSHLLALAVIALAVLAAPAAAQIGAGQQGKTKPQPRFSLRIDGFEVGSFTRMELTSEVEPAEYLEVGSGGPVFGRLFGKARPVTVTLERPFDGSAAMDAWHQEARLGTPSARRAATLVALDSANTPQFAYHLTNAFPSKLVVSSVPAGALMQVVQTVTLSAEHLQRDGSSGCPC